MAFLDRRHELNSNTCITLQYLNYKSAGKMSKYHTGHVGRESGAHNGIIVTRNDQGRACAGQSTNDSDDDAEILSSRIRLCSTDSYKLLCC